MAIEWRRYVVIATGPLKGHEPVTNYYDTIAEARDWAQKNLGFYRQIDLAEVQYRALTQLMPHTEIHKAD